MNLQPTIQWATPYSLALLLAFAVVTATGFVLLRLTLGRPMAPARQIGLVAVRLAVLAAVALIMINPVRVDKTPGAVELPRLFYLLDTSQSMAIGQGVTRWDHAVETIKRAAGTLDGRTGAQVSTFRFGSRLAAVSADFWQPAGDEGKTRGAAGEAHLAEPAPRAEAVPSPTEPDTLLGASLEGLTDRFGQAPPQAVVVFSDGRTRDNERTEKIAGAYARMKIPVHVFPVGDENVGGDVAVVSMVAPGQVRKHSKVSAQVFVRCYGYKGKRSEVKIVAKGRDGKPDALLAHSPIVLQDGLASYPLTFESGDQDRRIEAQDRPTTGRGVPGKQHVRG